MVCLRILSIAILLWSCSSYVIAQSPSIRFVDGSGKTLVRAEVIDQSGGLYLPVQTLREAFDPEMKQQYTSLTKQLTLNLRGKQLHLRIESLSVSVDANETKLSLSQPPLIIEGQLMLPLTFFTDILPEVYDFGVTHNPLIQTIHITEKDAPVPDLTPTRVREGPGKFLVILDPGHGGSDTGYLASTRVAEKDIVLDLAKEIEKAAREHQMAVVLTRDADSHRRPKERIDIAQQNQGKLFLSLHCNASFSPRAAGIHLYVSNSLGITQLDPPTNPNHTSQPGATIKAVSQEEYLAQSRQFARILQTELETLSPVPILLTEIPLSTLAAVYMPAVLMEVGYLSNEIDEARLTDTDSLALMAREIVEAIQTYIAESAQAEGVGSDR